MIYRVIDTILYLILMILVTLVMLVIFIINIPFRIIVLIGKLIGRLAKWRD